MLYAVTGTLNMADMALRIAQMPAEDTALLRTGAVLLILVFAIKAALVPLHFWLPSTYANAPGPVAALFAIMTKVGVYAIIRFFTIVFPQDTVIETVVADLLLPAALFTLIVGQIGILGSRNLGRLAAFAAIGSIGTLMIAVSQYTPQATAAAVYYLIHSTLSAAAGSGLDAGGRSNKGGLLRRRFNTQLHQYIRSVMEHFQALNGFFIFNQDQEIRRQHIMNQSAHLVANTFDPVLAPPSIGQSGTLIRFQRGNLSLRKSKLDLVTGS